MAIDYEALWRKAGKAHKNAPYSTPCDEAADQAAGLVLRDAFTAELAEVRAAHEQLYAKATDALDDRDRTIAERDAEIVRLRDMASSAIDLADGLHEGHDYLGTGSDSKSADKEYASDAKRIADFRAALGDRHHD